MNGKPGPTALALAVVGLMIGTPIGAGLLLVVLALVGLTGPLLPPIAWAVSAAGIITLDVLAYRALSADADARAEALRAARSS